MEITVITTIAYFVIMLGIGWWTSRGESAEGFLLGDRNLGTAESVATIVASKTGAGFLLVGTAIVMQFGLAVIWFALGQILGFLIFYFFVPHLRKLSEQNRLYTIADFYRVKHGEQIAKVVAAVSFTAMVLAFLINLLGGGKVLSVLSGWSFEVSLSAIFFVILVYILFGGYRAVSRTDFIQYLAIFVILGTLALAFFQDAIVLPGSFDLFNVPLSQIMGWFLLGLLLPFLATELWQRVYSAKSTEIAKKSIIWSSGIYVISLGFVSVIGIVIASAFPGIEPDTAFVTGLQGLLPGYLSVVASLLFFAAVMSSADTFLFTSSSVLIHDFCSKGKRSSDVTVRRLRLAILFIGFTVFFLAFFFRDLVELTFLVFAVVAPLGIIALVSWIRPNVRQATLVFSLVLAEVMVVGGSLFLEQKVLMLVAIAGVLMGLLFVFVFRLVFSSRS